MHANIQNTENEFRIDVTDKKRAQASSDQCLHTHQDLLRSSFSGVSGACASRLGIEMHRGYFKIWRKIEDSSVYRDATAFRVFFDLLVRANWKEGRRIIFKKQEITLRPGQLTVGRFEASERIGLSPSAYYRALKKLNLLYSVINLKTDSKWTLVTILNWDTYQNGQSESEHKVNTKRTASEQQVDTLKKVKHISINKKSCPFFESFWKSYPKKAGKKKAFSSWLRLKADEKLTKEIIRGVEKHKNTKQWQKDDGEFIPNPTTFLNQERWKDEGVEANESAADKIRRIAEEHRRK